MTQRLSLLLGVAAFVAALAIPATAGAQVFGKRGTAILPPAECPDTPGCFDTKCTFAPCYWPATPISCRWQTTKETPYYPGLCPHRWRGASYGTCDPDVAGCGMPTEEGYGVYSGARRDKANLIHLAANGPHMPATADIIDAIQVPHACPR